jgi:cell division protein FtsA
MSRNIATGIDIGTYQVKIVVAETDSSSPGKKPRVIGTGYAESRGLRHGYIVNSIEVSKSLKKALEQAEKSSGMRVKTAYLSVGGIGLQSAVSSATMPIPRADSIITDADITKSITLAEQSLPASEKSNRRIIHTIPISYSVDGESVYGEPKGMKGKKLEVKVLFVTCLERHLNDVVEVVNDIGVEILDIVASPIAASLVTLTKSQKVAGAILANIGSETVSIVVYENNIPLSLAVFPVGSTDITHGIALGLKIPLEEAESVKKGIALSDNYPKKKIEDIITTRVADILDLIEAHLKKIGRNALLPAGIVITGGGSSVTNLDDMAKAALKLPSRVALFGGKDGVKDSAWSVAYGLCILGLTNEASETAGIKVVRPVVSRLRQWIAQFLP